MTPRKSTVKTPQPEPPNEMHTTLSEVLRTQDQQIEELRQQLLVLADRLERIDRKLGENE